MEEFKKTANGIFNRFKDKDKVFITSDGQAFFLESDAKNHALKNRTGKELKLEVFLREAVEPNAKTAKPAKELIAEIGTETNIEAIMKIIEKEKAENNRKLVIEAAEKRIKQLSNNQ
jgi:beta-glucosidase/6-phospho-beta-glucosidase/beta-galactosidase